MLAYDAVDKSCRDSVDIPLAAQLLMISGIISGLHPFEWVQIGKPPGSISIAMLTPPIFEFVYNMINFSKQNKSLVVP